MLPEFFSGEGHEVLRFENEFLKAKLLFDKGIIKMVFLPERKLPLEIENDFLNDFAFWDMDDIEEIPIYDFIGKPDFINEKDLSDDLLPAGLERLNDLLFEHNIIYSVLSSVEARLVYKFLTEELFQTLIHNLPDADIGSHYFYEDFHRNHEYETREACDEFIDAFFNSSVISTEDEDYAMDLVRNFVDLFVFHDAFEEFRNVKYEFTDAANSPGENFRTAKFSFDAVTSSGTKPIHYSGEATFELEYEDECWKVIYARFPGMREE